MPRINVTDEELVALEKLRRKNENTLGYNEGLEIAALQIETGGAGERLRLSNLVVEDFKAAADLLRALKRPLPL